MRKLKIVYGLQTTDLSAKQSEIWDSWGTIGMYGANFYSVVFRAMFGCILVHFFGKHNFQNAAFSTLMILFQPNVFFIFRCDSWHKSSVLEILKLKI